MVRQKEQPSWSPMRFSYPELREMSALRTIFSAVTGWTESDVVVDMPGALDHATTTVQFVTDGYFSIVGLRPAHGSGCRRQERRVRRIAARGRDLRRDVGGRIRAEGRDESHGDGEWSRRANHRRRSAAVQRRPRWRRSRRLMMWLPLATRSAILAASTGANSSTAAALSSVDSTLFEAVGRLQPGVSPEQATAAVRVVATHAIVQMTPPRTVGPNAAKPPVLVYDADVARLRGWAVGGSGAMGMAA